MLGGRDRKVDNAMGTNYYLKTNSCAHCGRSDEPLHIGKSSGGWCFSLRIYPDDGINTLGDWRTKLASGGIVDEYGNAIELADMIATITERSHPKNWTEKRWASAGYSSEEHFHRSNNSLRGPNNLLRHKLDGRFCVGHGEGTWDYIVGEFS